MPTIAIKIPIQPTIQPLIGNSPEHIVPHTEIPIIDSKNISHDLKFNAIAIKNGIKKIKINIPIQLPINEPKIAVPNAVPAFPFFANAWPSIIVGTASGVPGIFISIADIAPPKTDPVYTPSIKQIAISWSIVDVNPINNAIAIVVDKPGRAPQIIPNETPNKIISSKNG